VPVQPVLDGTKILVIGADEVFKGRNLFPVDLARTADLPGSVVYAIRGQEQQESWFYEPLASVKPTMEKDENKLFEAIVDKRFLSTASAAIFLSLSANMANEDKASVLIQDLYTLTGPERQELQPKIKEWLDSSPGHVTQVFYCRAIKVSAAVSQVYRKITSGGKISGPVFGVNGEYYSASSLYAARSFVTWDAVPLPLPDSKSPVVSNQMPPQILDIRRRER
jgi:hypothetical protein